MAWLINSRRCSSSMDLFHLKFSMEEVMGFHSALPVSGSAIDGGRHGLPRL